MSFRDWDQALELNSKDSSFYMLIMAAMLRADTENIERLRAAWPRVFAEVSARYNAPGGRLKGEFGDGGGV
jgi:hypothetical protein